MERGEIPTAPIFLDSPLAIRATEVFRQHAASLDPNVDIDRLLQFPSSALHRDRRRKQVDRQAFRLPYYHRGKRHVRCRPHPASSQALALEAKATVLLVGFQAHGTLGRFLDDGAKAVRIQGEEIKVAARIRRIDEYSGHADGPRAGSLDCGAAADSAGVFLVHGEEPAIAGLSARIAERIFRRRRSSCRSRRRL